MLWQEAGANSSLFIPKTAIAFAKGWGESPLLPLEAICALLFWEVALIQLGTGEMH